MAYVRRRITKAGSVSTALVEAYRDGDGRPRQRLLASLHGEPTPLEALAKLTAQRAALREERETLTVQAVDANRFYEVITQQSLHQHQYSADERKEIDALLRKRERLLARIAKIDAALPMIERDGGIIKKYCTATPGEIQAAIKSYKKKLSEAEALVFGMEFGLQNAKAKLRRMSVPVVPDTRLNKALLRKVRASDEAT
jgi:hypothetical protein